MSTEIKLMTAEDLWQLPPDGNFHELVRGKLRAMPPAGFEHGAIGTKLFRALDRIVEGKNLGLLVAGDTGFLIAQHPDSVRAPDIGFVCRDRIQKTGIPTQYWPGPPDLAVEIISPSDTVYGISEKVEEWLEAGAGMVWVVNPRERTISVYRTGVPTLILTGNETLNGEPVIPGFAFKVKDLFV
jgi:Uma2 family endonuclease